MDSYNKVNFTLAAVLSLVLLLLFCGISLGAVRCQFDSQLGIPCKSCGVSRDIFQYLQLNFANPLNPHSLKIFTFFLGQIIIRFYLWLTKKNSHSSFIKLDITLSTIWSIWVFGSLLFN